MAEAEWFYAKSGEQKGPVSWAALQNLARSGELNRDDLVWSQGMNDWQPAERVGDLFPAHQIGVPPAAAAWTPAPPTHPPGPYPPPAPPPIDYQPVPQAQSYHGTAVSSFVVALAGFVCFGMILGIIAIILATNALSGMNRTGNQRGRGFAIAGLVIGIIDVAAWVLLMFLRLRGV